MTYVKKMALWGLIGISIGGIGMTIVVIIGQVKGDSIPTEILTTSYIASMGIGFLFGAIPIIFTIDEWSLLKQTIVHFTLMIAVFLPISLWAGWLPLKPLSVSIFLGTFVLIYIVMWFIQYLYWRRKTEKLNAGRRKESK